MVPIVTQLASDFDGRALVGTVDVNTQAALTRDYGVTSVPTFVFFKNGREVSRQSGTTTYEDLAAKLQALLASP
jgi:thioredoxin 1